MDVGSGPVIDEDPPADTVVVADDDDSAEGLALSAAEQAWVDGRYGEAVEVTDSLARAWSRRPGLDEGPIRRLARLLLARAEDVAAVDLLLTHPSALDADWRDELRAASERLSVAELDDLSRRISRDDEALGTVRAELARALALTGDGEAARRVARELEDADLRDADRRKVEDVLAGRVAEASLRIRLGFIAPRSGGFAPVGDQLIEGARLAALRYEERTGIPVELVVADEAQAVDSTGITFSGTDLARLDAIVGPVRSEGLRAAAARRPIPGLALLSPTASEDSSLAPHAYSLWDRARRDSLEATVLANWMASAFEPARVGALHPDDESGRRRARILREIAESAGFEWVGAEAYEPDSTTYEAQIRRLTEADPDIVYAVADGPRQVLQVAPQLHFYGLRGRITLVNQDWTHPAVTRRLDEPFSDYRVAGVYFERESNPAWREFAAAWDEEYRRSLPENAFAALGYDAVTLILAAIPDPALRRPEATARALTRMRDAPAVTGTFRFDPARRGLTRDARVWMILNSELVEPDPQAIVDWSTDTRELEEQRLEREAEEEARRRAEP